MEAFERMNLKDPFIESLASTQADTIRLVLAGHSLGEVASIIASSRDSHIAGCINLDGSLARDKKTKATELTLPVLTLLSDHEICEKIEMLLFKSLNM